MGHFFCKHCNFWSMIHPQKPATQGVVDHHKVATQESTAPRGHCLDIKLVGRLSVAMLSASLNTAKKVSCTQFISEGLHREPFYVLKAPQTGLLTCSLLWYKPETKSLTAGRCIHNDNHKPAPCLFETICRKAPQSPLCFASGGTKGVLFSTGRPRQNQVLWMGLSRCQGGSLNVFLWTLFVGCALGSSLDVEGWLSTSWIQF